MSTPKTEEQRERARARRRKWYQENKEYVLQYQQDYEEKNRDKLRLVGQIWRRKNHEILLTKQRVRLERYRKEVIAFFGGRCIHCGFYNWRVLQLDHINGDGFKERTNKGTNRRSSHKRWKYIREHPEEARRRFQLLCANCNWIKRHERAETGLGRKRTHG